MTYIKNHMMASLADHVLDKRSESHYVMRRPGTGMYLVHIAEVGGHIVLTGDLAIGGPHGCVSAGGYGIPWFSTLKSEGYLCEKFLRKKWQLDLARREIAEWLREPWQNRFSKASHKKRVAKVWGGVGQGWWGDEPCEFEFMDSLREIDHDLICDGVPGYGWPEADAGWLCAINKKFSELIKLQ